MSFALCQPDIPELSYIMCFHFCWNSLLEQVRNALRWVMGNSCCLSFIFNLLSDMKNVKSPYIQKFKFLV